MDAKSAGTGSTVIKAAFTRIFPMHQAVIKAGIYIENADILGRMVLLHGFIKKCNKTHEADLELATKRMEGLQ